MQILQEPMLYLVILAICGFLAAMWFRTFNQKLEKLQSTMVSQECCLERRTNEEKEVDSKIRNSNDATERVADDLACHIHTEKGEVQFKPRQRG